METQRLCCALVLGRAIMLYNFHPHYCSYSCSAKFQPHYVVSHRAEKVHVILFIIMSTREAIPIVVAYLFHLSSSCTSFVLG